MATYTRVRTHAHRHTYVQRDRGRKADRERWSNTLTGRQIGRQTADRQRDKQLGEEHYLLSP